MNKQSNFARRENAFRGSQRDLTSRASVYASAVAGTALAAYATTREASAAPIAFTSASQLSGTGNVLVSNEGDFTINSSTPANMSSLAFLKNGQFVGYANNSIGFENYLDGKYLVNKSETNPALDLTHLVVGEKPSGMWAFYDLNGNGKFGDINGTTLTVEAGEGITDANLMTINGVTGSQSFAQLPAYTGISSTPILPSINVNTSMLPEPGTLALVGTVALAAIGAGIRKHFMK